MGHIVKHAAPGPQRSAGATARPAARRRVLDGWVFYHQIDVVGVLLLIALLLVYFVRFGQR
jgi:hypothetical protein